MAKRNKYNIGDVFLIKLENGLLGIGRILKISKATVFIELYKIHPISKKSEYISIATQEAPALMIWSYDDALKNGEWEIIDNIPVDSIFEMPYLWTKDAGNGKYYLIKGTDTSYGEATGIIISEEEINKYPPYGIINPLNVPIYYVRKLHELGIL